MIKTKKDCYEILIKMPLPEEPCDCHTIHYSQIEGKTNKDDEIFNGFYIQRINRDVFRVNIWDSGFYVKSMEVDITGAIKTLYQMRKQYNFSLKKQTPK